VAIAMNAWSATVDSGSEEEDDDEIQGKTKLAQTLFS
jgi:hypothetical protein